jgi:cyclophilin family peptidyl-prolyl cis-trans isomerase/protein-disulfide isomerase
VSVSNHHLQRRPFTYIYGDSLTLAQGEEVLVRKAVLLVLVLSLGLVAGCGEEATPSPPPPTPTSAPPSPTPVPSTPEMDPTDPPTTPTPSGPATCEVFTIPVESRIPSIGEDDHVIGPEDAEITFIEYADFQCPACSGMHTLRDYLIERYGDQIRFSYRHLPLISIHDKALITAEAAEAAAAQGKFWEMHDLLYENIQEWNGLSEEDLVDKLVEYAGELELDAERFEEELNEHTYQEQIMADYEAYQEYGRLATPTYVVNKSFYPTQELGGFGQLEAFIGLIVTSDEMYDSPPPQVIDSDKDYVATIRTTKGDIKVELFDDQVPTNVNSFVFLVQDGWYDGLDFFYVDHERLALTGDPSNSGGGLPYPGYYCSDEPVSDYSFDEPGLLALYTPAPNRNSSAFFITYSPQPEFTGNFTIIGRVTEGMAVAESLTATRPGADQPEPDAIETIVIEEN